MNIRHGNLISLFTLLLICLLGAGAAQAQKVQVKAADPSEAEQGTINLAVTISGNGFDNGSIATFLVSGTINPGGVIVNNTQFVNSRKLVANITIDEAAVLGEFDIEVETLSGRRGKGNTLFAVFQKGGSNQDEVGSAIFSGELSGDLNGSFIDDVADGGFETLSAQLTGTEMLAVTGSAGAQLIIEDNDSPVGILPSDVGFGPDGCEASPPCDSVVFNSASPTVWTIRLDHDRSPPDRVQFRLNWSNTIGEQHWLRVGWVISGDHSPSGNDFGELTVSSPSNSLRDAEIEFVADPYRIDGKILTGKGKKTKRIIYSEYGEDGLATFYIDTSVP